MGILFPAEKTARPLLARAQGGAAWTRSRVSETGKAFSPSAWAAAGSKLPVSYSDRGAETLSAARTAASSQFRRDHIARSPIGRRRSERNEHDWPSALIAQAAIEGPIGESGTAAMGHGQRLEEPAVRNLPIEGIWSGQVSNRAREIVTSIV